MKTVDESLKVLSSKVKKFPELLVMLGTGWNKVLEDVEVEVEVGYKDLFGVEATVPGHEGKLVVASVKDSRVAFMKGRLHMYEGYSGSEATMPIRVFAELGVKKMVVTSASGGINDEYKVGDFVILNDMITVFVSLDNPLKGPKFLDLSKSFDEGLRKVARGVMEDLDLSIQEGVYMFLHGPNFETPADKLICMTLGADVVGMSTVPETMMARWLGIKVLGLSMVTNLAFVEHSHEDVVAAAERSSEGMVKLLGRLVSDFGG